MMAFRVFLAAVAFAWMLDAPLALAGERSLCRAGSSVDDPMTTNEGYGIAKCDTRSAPRYHRDDYAGRIHRRASPDDPMQWNFNQWRGDLMASFARGRDDRFDRRFHVQYEGPAVQLNIRLTVAERWMHVVETSIGRARPQMRVHGTASNRLGARAPVARRMQAACGGSGPAILVWTGAKAERVCAPAGAWRGRITVPSADPSLDKG
jgi:hypothetical protein